MTLGIKNAATGDYVSSIFQIISSLLEEAIRRFQGGVKRTIMHPQRLRMVVIDERLECRVDIMRLSETIPIWSPKDWDMFYFRRKTFIMPKKKQWKLSHFIYYLLHNYYY